MRNLKKVMALALATVMLFGMMVMGAGAADYTDAADIAEKYNTPVALLKAMEIFEGNDAGALNPKSTLTRAEAAVSIAKLALTKGIAAKLGTAATDFADVDDSYAWASGAIAWADSLDIIGGYNGKYDPAGQLTGYAYAKMLLVVLGYDPAVEGYINNANWASNVNLDAIQAGLLNGLTIDMGANILREEAIQMVYNALLADCVWYETAGTSITLPDGTVISAGGSAAKKVANTKEAGYLVGADNDEGMQLIEKLYKNFKLKTATVDANGYATKTWVNATTGKSVVVENNYTVLASYTDAAEAVKTGKIYADAGYVEKKGVEIYVNDFDTKLMADGKAVTTDIKLDGKGQPAIDFAGATLEYVKNGSTYALIIKYPTLTTVSKVNAATAAAGATVEFKDVYNLNDKDEKVYVKVETDAYVKDQKVFVTTGKDAAGKTIVLAHKAATVITGTVTETAKDTTNEFIFIDGTKYPVAGYATVAATLGKEYKVVVENGYIVEMTAVTAAPTKPTLSKVYYVGAMSGLVEGVYADDADYYVAKLVSLADGTVIDQKITANASMDTTKDENDIAAFAQVGELATIIDETEIKDAKDVKTGMKALKKYTGVADTFAVDYDFDAAALAATDKSITVDTDKAYFTANSVVLTIENLGKSTVKATAKTAPVAGKYVDAFVITSLNKTATADKADEVEIIVVVKENFTAAVVETVSDLYYVLKGDLGQVYDATAKKTLTKVEAVNLKTFEKEPLTVLATLANGGFADLKTDATTGLKTFAAHEFAPTEKFVTVAKEDTVDIYGNLITVDKTAIKDADFANAKFYNAAGVKVDNKAIATIAGLVKDGAAVADFVVKYTVAATTGVVTVDYVVVVG